MNSYTTSPSTPLNKGTKPVVIPFYHAGADPTALDVSEILSRSTARRESDANGTDLVGVEVVYLERWPHYQQASHGKPTFIEGQERLYRPPAARGLQEGRRFDIGASTAGPTPPPERPNCHPRRASTIRSNSKTPVDERERENRVASGVHSVRRSHVVPQADCVISLRPLGEATALKADHRFTS